MYMQNAFPKELEQDFAAVFAVIPTDTFSDCSMCVSENSISYKLGNETILIPESVYFFEPEESKISKLTEMQKQILYCIYTRSCEGRLREKYVQKLLEMDFAAWSIPYIVKLSDEYVIEILFRIYEFLRGRKNEDIKAFCIANKEMMRRSYSRMISYWNEYYREGNPVLDEYIGEKVFRECFDYNKTFEMQEK